MHKLSFNSKHFIPRGFEETEKYEKMRLQRILSQEIIEGHLDLSENQFITDLGNIKEVRGDLILSHSSIKSLSKLERVRGSLDLDNSKIEDLGNLKYVGRYLWLHNTPLSKRFKSQKELEQYVRSKVNVEGEIYA